jgi:subtilisin family serine protease/phosphatidylserine/phosphatidylglycerophosphate/cardiolipin synthase-like enzyme
VSKGFRDSGHNKIDPFLSLHLLKRDPAEYFEMEGSGIYAFEEITVVEDPVVNFTLKFKGDLESLTRSYDKLIIRSTVDDLAVAEAPISVIRQLAESKYTVYMESSMPLSLELDRSTPEIRVDQVRQNLGLKGKDVICGIIDSGIDYTHLDFRNADGTTRIIYLWDQNQRQDDTLPSSALGQIPSTFNYGREYSKQDIDTALQSGNPFSRVPQKDDHPPSHGHGTHVAGIVAGNGRASNGRYAGMAPSSDIIFVKYWSKENLGDSNTLIDAVKYIFDKADQLHKPAVINISMGNQLGPHDGTSQFELFIDKLLMEKIGRAIVKSAGNDGNNGLHAEGKISQVGEISILKFSVNYNDIDDDLISLWYDIDDQFEISVTSPSGETTPNVKLMDERSFPLQNGNVVEIAHRERDKDQVVNSVIIALKKQNTFAIEEGIWSINITGRNVTNGKFDAWIERLSSGKVAPRFLGELINQKSISIPGTSHYIITVGDYASGSDIANTSSIGPTREGRLKPEISCPGTKIMSAASSQIYPDSVGKYVSLSGTSMAAPTVAGVIVLMFEKQPTLSTATIKTILSTSGRRDSNTGTVPNYTWGYGKIDALSALNQLPFTEATPIYVGSGMAIELSSGCPFTSNYQHRELNWLTISGKATLFASPDSTFQAIKEALGDVDNGDEVFIAIYDFSVNYVAELIKEAINKGARVKLMVDKDKRKGSHESEAQIIQDLRNSGVAFAWTPSCNNNFLRMFTNCHQKTVVVSAFKDNKVIPRKVMISSGNWSTGGIPYNIWLKNGQTYNKNPKKPFKNGNREWGIIIENKEIAQQFYEILIKDFEESKNAESRGLTSPAVEEFIEEELLSDLFEEDISDQPKQLFPPANVTLKKVKVLPLLCPDNYSSVVSKLLESATKSIWIQQQTINPNGRHGIVNSIIDSIIKAKNKKPNLDVKFMRSSKFMSNTNLAALKQLQRADCEVKFHNPRQYGHLHNKGIIIDGTTVIISSTNFTDTSIFENRECGIVIQSEVVSKYFRRLFELDWNNGVDHPLDKPLEIITIKDPRIRNGRYRKIDLGDFIEL